MSRYPKVAFDDNLFSLKLYDSTEMFYAFISSVLNSDSCLTSFAFTKIKGLFMS